MLNNGKTLRNLRWLAVIAPTVAVTTFETSRHLLLDDRLPLWAVPISVFTSVGLGALVFSLILFGYLERMQEEVLLRNRELSAHNEVGMAVSRSLDLGETLGRALETVLKITGAEAGEILVLEDESQELVLRVHRGPQAEALEEQTRFRLGEGLPGTVAQSGEPVLVRDLLGEPRFQRQKMLASGFHSFAGVPLKSKNRVVGVMGIASSNADRLSPEVLDLLASLGNQIGVAIENAALMEQMRYMDILEERDRLGKEIHDSFGQTLGYLNMQSRAIEDLLTKGKYERAINDLRQMGAEVRGAFNDVREAIFSLRKTADAGRGLVATLREYSREFSRNSGITVDLAAPQEQDLHMPPGVQVQLVRIVQEALNNTRKYAGASHASVSIERSNSNMLITVEDDGTGFDQETVGKSTSRSFGLSIMRERAESVGARFSIESEPGRGTRVVLELPNGKAS